MQTRLPLKEIWREDELAARLSLPIGGETGRSRTLSNWIAEGLPYIEKNGRRYFIENDVTTFLQKYRRSKTSQDTL